MSDYEKPCPFCGSTNLKSGGDDKIVGTWCLDCEATGPNHYGRYEWNDRADRIEELEAENKNLRHMILDRIKSAGDDPEIMAASRAEWAARAKAAEAKLAKAVEALQVFADDANWFDTPDGDGVTMNATWRGLIYAPELFARDVIEKLTGDRRITDTTREASDYLVEKLRLWYEVWPEDIDKPEGHLYEGAADHIEQLAATNEELEAKLAKAVEGMKMAKRFYQVTHIHGALDATLAELTGGNYD